MKENKDPRVKFIAIQNGFRILNGDNDLIKLLYPKTTIDIYHSNFFCFGEYDIEEYKKSGANVKNFYPCGSLIDSYHRSKNPSRNSEIQFDICVVSNTTSQFTYDVPCFGAQRESFELLLGYLKNFIKLNRKTVSFASALQQIQMHTKLKLNGSKNI